MSEVDTVILGVASGVLSAAFLYMVALIFKNHITPWYQSITYNGVDVSGTWVYEIDPIDALKARFEITIKQKAHSLYGDTTIIQGKDLGNPYSITNLKICGDIWEGYMTLNMQSKDRSRLSYSTSLLRVENGGATLKGNYVYRSIKTDEIVSQEIELRRKSS